MNITKQKGAEMILIYRFRATQGNHSFEFKSETLHHNAIQEIKNLGYTVKCIAKLRLVPWHMKMFSGAGVWSSKPEWEYIS